MYYGNTVTQNVTKTIPLETGKTEYSMDFENFGKFSVKVEYTMSSSMVSASETATVGIVACLKKYQHMFDIIICRIKSKCGIWIHLIQIFEIMEICIIRRLKNMRLLQQKIRT